MGPCNIRTKAKGECNLFTDKCSRKQPQYPNSCHLKNPSLYLQYKHNAPDTRAGNIIGSVDRCTFLAINMMVPCGNEQALAMVWLSIWWWTRRGRRCSNEAPLTEPFRSNKRWDKETPRCHVRLYSNSISQTVNPLYLITMFYKLYQIRCKEISKEMILKTFEFVYLQINFFLNIFLDVSAIGSLQLDL